MFAYTENCMKIKRYTISDKASSSKLGEKCSQRDYIQKRALPNS